MNLYYLCMTLVLCDTSLQTITIIYSDLLVHCNCIQFARHDDFKLYWPIVFTGVLTTQESIDRCSFYQLLPVKIGGIFNWQNLILIIISLPVCTISVAPPIDHYWKWNVKWDYYRPTCIFCVESTYLEYYWKSVTEKNIDGIFVWSIPAHMTIH